MAEKFLQDYVMVHQRVEEFYGKYPQGSIQTEIVQHDAENGVIVMKAFAYRTLDDPRPATGHAKEEEARLPANLKESALEICETSAVGRALAFAGFSVKTAIASREEVEMARLKNTEGDGMSSTEPATEKQIKFIRDLAGTLLKQHVLSEAKAQSLNDLLAKGVTKMKAKEIIDALVAKREEVPEEETANA